MLIRANPSILVFPRGLNTCCCITVKTVGGVWRDAMTECPSINPIHRIYSLFLT